MLIINGKLLLPTEFNYHDLRIENGRIAEILPFRSGYQDEDTYDARGSIVIPGLIDMEVHGACGYDMSDACEEAYGAISDYLIRHGVTTYVGAIDSFSEDILEEAYAAAGEWMKEDRPGARMIGLNMRGPFLNPEAAGHHDKEALRKPDQALFEKLQALSGGRIIAVNVSPELEGAGTFIRNLGKQVHILLSNTTADYDTARMAYAFGADWCGGVLYDMPPLTAKEPGPVGAAMDIARNVTLRYENARVIHPAMLRLMYKEFLNRLCLVSAMSAFTDLKPGRYEIEGHTVTKKAATALYEDGTDAGGVLALDSCLQDVLGMGAVPEDLAYRSVTSTPARMLGIFDEVGSIEVGKRADLAILDLHGYGVQATVRNGVMMYDERKNFD